MEQSMTPAERSLALHKKLIWPNIAIVVVSLIAVFTLLFGTWFDLKAPVDAPLVQTLAEAIREEDGMEIDEDMIQLVVRDLDSEIGIKLGPIDLLRAGLSVDRNGLKAVANSVFHDLTNAIAEISEQILPSVLTIAVVTTVFEQTGYPENFSFETLDPTVFQETISLLNDQEPAAAKTEFLQQMDTFAQEQLQMEITPENRDKISDIFDEAVELMTKNGEFSFSNFPTAVSQLMKKYSENGSLTEEESPVLDENDDLTAVQTRALMSVSTENLEQTAGAIDQLFELLENPDDFIDSMDESTFALVRSICLSVGIWMTFYALLWLILALFAFIHIFTRNKKVSMWYVKLTGLTPFLLSVVIPFVAVALLPWVIPQVPAITILCGGMTIASAVCYIALWLISIFWCHPIKRRIKHPEAYSMEEDDEE